MRSTSNENNSATTSATVSAPPSPPTTPTTPSTPQKQSRTRSMLNTILSPRRKRSDMDKVSSTTTSLNEATLPLVDALVASGSHIAAKNNESYKSSPGNMVFKKKTMKTKKKSKKERVASGRRDKGLSASCPNVKFQAETPISVRRNSVNASMPIRSNDDDFSSSSSSNASTEEIALATSPAKTTTKKENKKKKKTKTSLSSQQKILQSSSRQPRPLSRSLPDIDKSMARQQEQETTTSNHARHCRTSSLTHYHYHPNSEQHQDDFTDHSQRSTSSSILLMEASFQAYDQIINDDEQGEEDNHQQGSTHKNSRKPLLDSSLMSMASTSLTSLDVTESERSARSTTLHNHSYTTMTTNYNATNTSPKNTNSDSKDDNSSSTNMTGRTISGLLRHYDEVLGIHSDDDDFDNGESI